MISEVTKILKKVYLNKGKILVCGNGGSAADSLHIVGELMKGFKLKREIPSIDKEAIFQNSANAEYINANLQCAISAISLVNEVSLMTAYANDMAADLVFAQQVYGYGKEGDVLIAISTSGNSKNVIYAAEVAKAKGMKIISMTGKKDSELSKIADITLRANSDETYIVQEEHIKMYHEFCLKLEKELFGEN